MFTRSRIGLALLLCSLLLASPAWAQLDSLLDLNPTLEQLMNIEVVSTTRENIKITEAPANVIVITKEEIARRGYLNLEELLQDLPGFDMSAGQPAGEYPTHFMFRGIGDVGQTKFIIMVDGIVQNDISNGWARNMGYDFAFQDIERIEFVSGPGSALYGANAYAGMLNIITQEAEEEEEEDKTIAPRSSDGLHITANGLYGSNQTIAPELLTSYRFKNGLKLKVAGRYFRTAGDGGLNRPDPGNYFHNNVEPDSVFTTEQGNIANERDANGNTLAIPDGFNTHVEDYYIRGHLQQKGFVFGFNFWSRHEGLGSEVVGYEYFANTPSLDYLSHHTGNTMYLKYSFDISDRLTSNANMYYRNTTILPNTGFYYTYQYQSVDNGVDPAVRDKKKGYSGDGFVIGLEEQLNLKISDKNKLVAGFQIEQRIREYWGISLGPEQDVTSTIVQSTFATELPTVQPVYFSKRGAFFVQDQQKMGKHLSLTGGFRYDMDQFYGNNFNPRVAIVSAPTTGLNFKLLYGEAFKAPTIFELYDEWRGNVLLEPEKIATAEAEVGYTFARFGAIKTNVFYNVMSNLIEVAANPNPDAVPIGPQGQYATYYQNRGRTDITGLSFRGDLFFRHNFTFYMNYMYLMGDDGAPLYNVAQHKINAGINYLVLNKVNINLRSNWYSKVQAPLTNLYFQPKDAASIANVGYDYVTENNPDGFMDGFLLFNMSITGKNLFGEKIDLQPQLIVRNLLDTEYTFIGRQSGSGTRPIDAIQPSIQNPAGFIPAYHPQPGRQIYFKLIYTF